MFWVDVRYAKRLQRSVILRTILCRCLLLVAGKIKRTYVRITNKYRIPRRLCSLVVRLSSHVLTYISNIRTYEWLNRPKYFIFSYVRILAASTPRSLVAFFEGFPTRQRNWKNIVWNKDKAIRKWMTITQTKSKNVRKKANNYIIMLLISKI